MDGQHPQPGPNDGHNDLAHDEAVSLRPESQSLPPVVPPQTPAIPTQSPAPQQYVQPQSQPVVPSQPAPIMTPQASAVPPAVQPASPYAIEDDDPNNPYLLAQADSASYSGPQEISWSASEFIAHPKTTIWYAGLLGATIVLAVLGFLISRGDVITVVVIVIFGILIGYMGSRQPRQLSYIVSASGVTIGDKFYAYDTFRAFTVGNEGAFSSINFIPLKRLGIGASIYYDPAREAEIMELLTRHLPLDDHRSNKVDGLMNRIRF